MKRKSKEERRKQKVRVLARHLDTGGMVVHKHTGQTYGFHSVPNEFFDDPWMFEKVESINEESASTFEER